MMSDSDEGLGNSDSDWSVEDDWDRCWIIDAQSDLLRLIPPTVETEGLNEKENHDAIDESDSYVESNQTSLWAHHEIYLDKKEQTGPIFKTNLDTSKLKNEKPKNNSEIEPNDHDDTQFESGCKPEAKNSASNATFNVQRFRGDNSTIKFLEYLKDRAHQIVESTEPKTQKTKKSSHKPKVSKGKKPKKKQKTPKDKDKQPVVSNDVFGFSFKIFFGSSGQDSTSGKRKYMKKTYKTKMSQKCISALLLLVLFFLVTAAVFRPFTCDYIDNLQEPEDELYAPDDKIIDDEYDEDDWLFENIY